MRPPTVGTPCPTVSAIRFSARIDAKEMASRTLRIEDLTARWFGISGAIGCDGDGKISIVIVLHDIFAQRLIDAGLVAFIPFGVSPKPINQVGVKPQRDLLLDGTKQRAAPRAAPIAPPGNGGCVLLYHREARPKLSARLAARGSGQKSPSSYALLSCGVAFRALIIRPTSSPSPFFIPATCEQRKEQPFGPSQQFASGRRRDADHAASKQADRQRRSFAVSKPRP